MFQRNHDGRRRYDAVAMILHWVIAALILTNLGLAWRFEGLEEALRAPLIRLHKSVGVTVLLLSVMRLVWRLLHAPPPNPTLTPLERRLAQLVHTAFYGLIIGLPLSGWAMISASGSPYPTVVWRVLDWPRITPLARLPAPLMEQVHGGLAATHLGLALLMSLLLVVHVVAALKHQFVDRDGGGLERMLPFGRSGRSARWGR